MNRRSTFSLLLGRASEVKSVAAPPPSGSLAPYNGPWTVKEAGHLMRRATFGPSQSMIRQAVSLGMEASVDKLLTDDVGLPSAPLKWDLDAPHPNRLITRIVPYSNDPNVKYGETWVNAPILVNTGDPANDTKVQVSRTVSVYAWMLGLISKDHFSIREKMSIFWHNHFVVANFRLPVLMYQYMSTIHQNVLGNFKQLAKEMTIDPSMLLYLNGAENTKSQPNENYARELLELFTVGKGDIVGPGDYTTFTEDDVRELAKALTGWTIDVTSLAGSRVKSAFNLFNHDFTVKNLSHRFGNQPIAPAGQDEYKSVVDTIFTSPHVALHICRKIYRYFVYYDITTEIESQIIEPMASLLRSNDYQVLPVIDALLKSEHFYSEEAIGCMIKNPVDYYTSVIKGMGVQFDGHSSFIYPLDDYLDGTILDYLNSYILYTMCEESQMAIFNHPEVAGWKAYYQAPGYYRTWINSVTLPLRTSHTTALVQGKVAKVGDTEYTFNKEAIPVLDIIEDLDNPTNPNDLIYDLGDLLTPYGLTESQKDYLKEVLIPGLPDFEWTVEYGDYLADPGDPQKKEGVENRLRALFEVLLQLPESHLM